MTRAGHGFSYGACATTWNNLAKKDVATYSASSENMFSFVFVCVVDAVVIFSGF